jgi:hypothetical protein
VDDRRAFARHKIKKPSPVQLLRQEHQLVGMGVPDEVSSSGIGLLVSRPLPVGEVLTMMVVPPHPLAGRALSIRVCRCQFLAGGHLLAGAFIDRLTEPEVLALAGT